MTRAARLRAEVAIARMFGRKRRKRKTLPRQLPPRGIERDYAAALVRLIMPAIRAAFAPLIAELPGMIDSVKVERGDAVRHDAGEGKRIRERVAAAAEEMRRAISPERLEELATSYAVRTAGYQRKQLERQTRAALGADVFMGDRALKSLVDGFAAENVALIRGVTEDIAARIEHRSIAAVQGGKRHEDLARELQKEFGYPEKRAKLIARDQVGKLYGQINASRQKELGADRFIWRTVQDERVREEHEARNGQIYSYADPPDGELPGEPILCRCFAEPVFEGVNDQPVEPEASKPEPEPEAKVEKPDRPEPPSYETLARSKTGERIVKMTSGDLPTIRDINGKTSAEFAKTADPTRVARVAAGIKSGAVKEPIVIAVHSNGDHEIVQGRHRIIALADDPKRKYPVKFVQGSKREPVE